MSLCKRKIFRPLIKCIHHYYIQNKVNKPYNFCQLQEYVLDIKNSLRGSGSLKEDFATVRWHNNKLFWSGRTYQLRNFYLVSSGNVRSFYKIWCACPFAFLAEMRFLQQNLKVLTVYMFSTIFVKFDIYYFFYFISVEWDIQ